MCGSPTFRRSVLRYSSLVRCCRSRLAIPHGALLPGQLRSDPRRLSVLSAGPKTPERRRIRPFKGHRHATALHRRLAHARLQGKRVGWRARELRWERQARKKKPPTPPRRWRAYGMCHFAGIVMAGRMPWIVMHRQSCGSACVRAALAEQSDACAAASRKGDAAICGAAVDVGSGRRRRLGH